MVFEATGDEPEQHERIAVGDSLSLPPGTPVTLRSPSPDCELLVVTIEQIAPRPTAILSE